MKANVNAVNFGLIFIGLAMLALGLYRTVPLKTDRAFIWQNGPLALMLAFGLYFFYQRQQAGSLRQWMSTVAILGGRFLPLMILLCLVMGIGGVVTAMYRKEISDFLLNHHVLAPLGASMVTPTPNTVTPLIEELWQHKVLQPGFLYFLQAASLMSLPLFMLRQMGFSNPEISGKMYITGCIISIAAYPFMPIIYRLVNFIYGLGPIVIIK